MIKFDKKKITWDIAVTLSLAFADQAEVVGIGNLPAEKKKELLINSIDKLVTDLGISREDIVEEQKELGIVPIRKKAGGASDYKR